MTDSRATFNETPTGPRDPAPTRLPDGFALELIKDGRTPVRAMADVAIADAMRYLLGPGTIYELGAPIDYYKQFVPATQSYQLTDLHVPEGSDVIEVDMTAMPFEDDSIDAHVSVFSLEHVAEYRKAIDEMKRTLRPGGRLLLVVPFMYYYHAAPGDYVRFTHQYVEHLLDGMHLHRLQALGTWGLFIAESLHEKPFSVPYSSRPVRFLKRLVAAAVIAPYTWRPRSDPTYASTILALAEKPAPGGAPDAAST